MFKYVAGRFCALQEQVLWCLRWKNSSAALQDPKKFAISKIFL